MHGRALPGRLLSWQSCHALLLQHASRGVLKTRPYHRICVVWCAFWPGKRRRDRPLGGRGGGGACTRVADETVHLVFFGRMMYVVGVGGGSAVARSQQQASQRNGRWLAHESGVVVRRSQDVTCELLLQGWTKNCHALQKKKGGLLCPLARSEGQASSSVFATRTVEEEGTTTGCGRGSADGTTKIGW